MKRKLRSAVFVLLLAAAAAGVARADDSADASIKASPAAHGETMRHGLRAYADPETGELVSPDSVDTLVETGSGGAQQAPLEVVPAPTEAGGVMVDLRGQFMHETRARIVDGKLSADCHPTTSPP